MPILQLIPIQREDPQEVDISGIKVCQEVLKMQLPFYTKVGFNKPWIGYFALEDEQPVGSVGFKGKPKSGKVEIAYFTFPGHEGRGIGTNMCKLIRDLAFQAQPAVRVTARTLAEASASTSILKKNGFQMIGTLDDPEDGSVWEWEYQRS